VSERSMVATNAEDEPKLIYDPGEHRKKHCWSEPFAGVVRDGSTVIGKCPSTLTKEMARDLLDDAEYDGKVAGRPIFDVKPKRMWNVHEGIVYEAVPTDGDSYHGYPWFGRPGRNRLSRPVRAALERRAEDEGFGREFRDWMARHES